MADESGYRMDPNLGVIRWQQAIVVYRMQGDAILWARTLGGPFLRIDEALRTAILQDRSAREPGADTQRL